MNRQHSGQRVTAKSADASSPESMRRALRNADCVIMAASTSEYVKTVARAALETHTDYFDIQYSASKVKYLMSIRDEVASSNRCFITDGGFHPGLPGAMIRYAATEFELLSAAHIGSLIRIAWSEIDLVDSTYQEFISELLLYRYDVYKNSSWQQSMKNIRSFQFAKNEKPKHCYPMYLDELGDLPEQIPGLHEMGFYLTAFNPVVNNILMPLCWIALKLMPRVAVKPVTRLMKWGLQLPDRRGPVAILKMEAEGIRNGKPVTMGIILSHKDGYYLTAVPVVATCLQYLEGKVRKSGVHFQAHIVEPGQFFRDLERLGIHTEIGYSDGKPAIQMIPGGAA